MGQAVSDREREVLGAVAGRLTNAEIARLLHISVRTVESHVASLLRKTGAHDRRDLASLAAGILATAPGPSVGVLGLPTPITSFVGRAAEVAGLLRLLAGSRLVTLVGPGGVGKTRLAIAAAGAAAAADWPRGAFVNLVPVAPAFVVQAVAGVFGVGERPEETLLRVVVERLGAARHLVVLDNCEHVLAAAGELVTTLLEACPGTSVLATSRQRLDVEGERVFTVAPLTLVQGDPLASEAVRLFVDRTGVASDDPDDPRMVTEICRRLDGLPLAIELAAARRASLGLDGLLAGIEDHLRLLTRVAGSTDRHASLRTVIDWSHDLLDHDEQVTFRRLGAFAGSFDLGAADAVAGPGSVAGTGDLVGRLAEKSLLSRSLVSGLSRWRMLDSIRAYARERLAASGELEEVTGRHLRWAESEARSVADLLEAGGPWRARFDLVADDLRSAVVAGSPTAAAFDLAVHLGHLTFARRYLSESRAHLRTAVELAPGPAGAVRALRLAAGAAFSEMRGEVAYEFLLEASRRASAAGDRRTAAIVLAEVAALVGRAPALFMREFSNDEIAELLERARRLAPAGDLEVDTELAIAAAWSVSSRSDSSALALAADAVALARRLDDPRRLSIALDSLAAAYAVEHRFREAARVTAERVALLGRMARHDPSVGGEIADIYHMATQTALATGALGDALTVGRRQLHDEATHGLAHFAANNLVIALALRGEFDEATAQADLMLAGWEQAGRPAAAWMGPPYYAAALVHGLRGDTARYATWREHAAVVTRGRPASGFAWYSDARVALHVGDLERARLAAEPASSERDYAPFVPYVLAVAAEVAAVSQAPDREDRLSAATVFSRENDFVAAHLDRVSGILRDEPVLLERAADRFGALGARFERACSLLHLPGRADDASRELAAIGCRRPRSAVSAGRAVGDRSGR